MDLTQLEVFRAVAEQGSVTAAAERLHRVPSNISTRLRQLEEELGTELFTREKLRLHITDAGRTLLDYACRILALTEEARQRVSGQQPAGIFTLGAIESTAAVHLPPLIARYHQAWPEVELDLSTGPSGDMIEGLLAGSFSAVFIDGPPRHPLLEGVAVFPEEMVIISSLNHPPVTSAKNIAGATVYAFRANCSYRRLFENWFADSASAPGKIFEMESYHGIVACVSAGAGLAMIPLSMLENMPGRDSVQAWPIAEQRGKIAIWLVWQRGAASANLRAMVNLLESCQVNNKQHV
ncbi:putrescine utilization regulator PtrR [Erwinia psidii]|uniref:LysR family transcriptional regulator n=1 Tax=Erwinia psidii TaxID=69224 RepID=A0A3N6SM58_9GAMM|nr:LysR family transcriptional regulator [Erwinia psidii]MCX8955971.1 LysR family transcriptional regulator [Erwinia psidii]MCX8961343.1 LysR family transcriptional regulator [Erwinia psidii]MCX8963811.1 LysR family transcriptional regulator [Erwinia psidii]RQM38796.1 LysR family transcriptional regulator [Erwinia psidii]